MMRISAFAILLALSSQSLASNIRSLPAGAPSPAAAIEDIAWLAGHWEGEGLRGRSFETISPPVAGQMVGHFQQVSDGRVQFYEFYQFAQQGESLILRIKHFNADMTGWEDRTESEEFPLVAIETGAAYFDGVTFRKTGANTLESFVRVSRGGREEEIRFTFRRVAH